MNTASFAPALRRRIVRAPLSGMGILLAAPMFILALTPSLLPRPLASMILLASIGSALGYALGASIAWAWRRIPLTAPHRMPRHWLVVLQVLSWAAAVVFTAVAISWQLDQQVALEMPATLPSSLILLLGSGLGAAALVTLARSLRLGTNTIARWASTIPILWKWTTRRGPMRQYRRVMLLRVAAAAAVILLFNCALGFGFSQLTAAYDRINTDVSGQSDADLGANSGSAQSLAPWATLGREGRFFVSNTMKPEEIESITQEPAVTPLRLYVGVEQGSTPQARSTLVLQELDRSHAWDRKYLAVMALTGTGWVEPDAINSIETVTGGNVASIGVQYSSVPSWIGFLVDQQTTQIQNADTIHAIIDAWHRRPADHRPELVLFGESLGAFGSQAAWSPSATPEQVTADFSSVIWIGPPAGSILWRQWQADPTGGPAWQPVIGDGSLARVFVSSDELLTARPTAGRAITIAAHPNDPVVYWSWDLLFNRPDWIDPPLGPGVDSHLRYSWVLTCLQVGMDLISGGEPPEVGHNYVDGSGPAIALTINPPGWSPAKTQAMQQSLGQYRYETG